jgi:type II secretory pathway pseudopilin PulG
MIEVLFVMIIIGIMCAVAIPMYLGQRDKAKNAVTREGGRTLALALLSSVATSDDGSWPAHCDEATLRPFLNDKEWPTNPFTGVAMKEGAGDGDFAYEPVPGAGSRHRLRVHLHALPDFLVP